MKKKNQTNLFDNLDNSWENEWKDMPEFIQEDLTSNRKIIVHFRTQEDVIKFSELIRQKITPKQSSLWFPEMPPRRYAHLRYVYDEK
jgi:hypothetical protein